MLSWIPFAHFHNCAVIGPQNRHKNKHKLKSGKGPRGDQFKKPYLGNYLEYRNKILPYELDQSFYE